MKRRRGILGWSTVGLVLLATAGMAGDQPQRQGNVQQQSLLPIPPPLQEYYYGGLEPKRLAYALDLWYDAVLKGDDDQVADRESILFGLLQQDVDSTGRVLRMFNALLARAEADATRLDTGQSLSDDYPLLEALNRDIYSEAWDVYKNKQKLLTAVRRSGSISNKYRLMSDYIEVLRREIGLPRLRLATTQQQTPVDVKVSEGSTEPSGKN